MRTFAPATRLIPIFACACLFVACAEEEPLTTPSTTSTTGDASIDRAAYRADLARTTPPPDLALPTKPDLAIMSEPPGMVCGGFAGRPCPAGFFCEMPAGGCCCDFEGTCQPIPTSCPAENAPVCDCGGTLYPGDCARRKASASPAPCPSTVRCGNTTCAPGEVCTLFCCDAAGDSCDDSTAVCSPIPSSCSANRTCACIDQFPDNATCSTTAAGSFLLKARACP